MKKIIYFLFLLVFVVGFSSCNEEDYKNINITNYEEPIDIKEFVGDMTAQIVVKNPDGINVTDVDMGSTF